MHPGGAPAGDGGAEAGRLPRHGAGVIALGAVLMFFMYRRNPEFFKGEVLSKASQPYNPWSHKAEAGGVPRRRRGGPK